jgi:hypothetical protein
VSSCRRVSSVSSLHRQPRPPDTCQTGTPLRSNAAKGLIRHVVIAEDVRIFKGIELDSVQRSRTSLIPGRSNDVVR